MRPTTEFIDRRYSDARPDAQPAWIVTVRADASTHASPMIPLVHVGEIHLHTGSDEVKYSNLLANQHVLVLVGATGWNRGLDVSVEGIAELVTEGGLVWRLAELNRQRRDGSWQLEVQDGALVPGVRLDFFEVTPQTVRCHAKSAPTSQTTYLF